MDISGETCGRDILPYRNCRDGYGRNLPRLGDVRVPQQFKDREAVRTGHLYVGQQKIIPPAFSGSPSVPGHPCSSHSESGCGRASPGDLQLDAVVIHDQHTDAAGRFTGRKHLLPEGRTVRPMAREGKRRSGCLHRGLYLHTAPHFRHEPGRDRQPCPNPECHALSSLSNAPNIRSFLLRLFPCRYPGQRCKVPPYRYSASRRTSPWGVNFRALDSRLSAICRICEPSQQTMVSRPEKVNIRFFLPGGKPMAVRYFNRTFRLKSVSLERTPPSSIRGGIPSACLPGRACNRTSAGCCPDSRACG